MRLDRHLISILALALLSVVALCPALSLAQGRSVLSRGAFEVFPAKNANHELCRSKVPGVTCEFKYGRNESVGAAKEDIWPLGATYPFVGDRTAELIDCVSDDADDTSAGTGARTIFIRGLDANYVDQTEMLTMNGLTQVQSANTYIRMFRSQNVTAGSSEINEGNITCDGATSGDVAAYVMAGAGTTLQAVYTVPAGHNAVLTNNAVSVERLKDVETEVYVRPFGTDTAWRKGFIINIYEAFVPLPEGTVGVLPEKTDIVYRASSSVGAAAVSAQFMVYLYPN